MRLTSIDFADPVVLALRPLRGWAVLPALLGMALIGYGIIQLVDIERAISKAEEANAAKSRSSARLAVAPSTRAEFSPAQILAANAAIRRMNVPWRDLLDAIEQATPPEIALIELDPDPAQGELRAEAEAKDLESMSNYIDRLQKSPMFDGVVLVKHEINAQDVNHPIRFQLLAQWARTSRGKA